MPIPALGGTSHAYWLSPGTHDCRRYEVEAAFVYNRQREKVWRYFMYVMERFRDVGGSVDAVLVDGSFVTGRALPEDVDAVCHIPPAELRQMLAASSSSQVLQFFLRQPHAARELFGVHLFVVPTVANLEDLRTTFATGLNGRGLRPPDPRRDPPGLVVPSEKGILRVAFSDFFQAATP